MDGIATIFEWQWLCRPHGDSRERSCGSRCRRERRLGRDKGISLGGSVAGSPGRSHRFRCRRVQRCFDRRQGPPPPLQENGVGRGGQLLRAGTTTANLRDRSTMKPNHIGLQCGFQARYHGRRRKRSGSLCRQSMPFGHLAAINVWCCLYLDGTSRISPGFRGPP